MDAPEPDPTAEAREPNVAELKAQVDELNQQVEKLAHQRVRKHRIRKITAVFLVVVFALSFVASGVGIWLQRNTLNDNVWNERVVPLGKDPEVQKALAAWTTRELMKVVDPQALFQEALPERAQILAVPLTAVWMISDYVSYRRVFHSDERVEPAGRV